MIPTLGIDPGHDGGAVLYDGRRALGRWAWKEVQRDNRPAWWFDFGGHGEVCTTLHDVGDWIANEVENLICAGDTGGIGWLFDATLTVHLWAGMDAWGLQGSWPWNHDGWQLYLHPLRWIVGDTRYEEENGPLSVVQVKMPEGKYEATVAIKRVRWNRRLWRGAWRWRGSIEVPGGIPVPGKGENSWDCDDDAVYGCTFAVEDERPAPHDLANRLALDALRTRVRHGGGTDWTPSNGWPEKLWATTP